MARAGRRTTPPGGSAPVWLRLEGKTIEPDGLTLEFVAAAQRSGHGQRPDQLGELLAAGDLVRIRIRLDGPVTIDVQTSLGGLGTPAAEDHTTVPPEMPSPPPAEGEVNEERRVAITQELAPLEPGGEEEPEGPPPEPPPDGEHGVMLAGAAPEEPRRRVRASTARPREFHLGSYQSGPPVDPARLAELREQVAAGKYEPFALFRKAATR